MDDARRIVANDNAEALGWATLAAAYFAGAASMLAVLVVGLAVVELVR
jgi:hypothetical protein